MRFQMLKDLKGIFKTLKTEQEIKEYARAKMVAQQEGVKHEVLDFVVPTVSMEEI